MTIRRSMPQHRPSRACNNNDSVFNDMLKAQLITDIIGSGLGLIGEGIKLFAGKAGGASAPVTPGTKEPPKMKMPELPVLDTDIKVENEDISIEDVEFDTLDTSVRAPILLGIQGNEATSEEYIIQAKKDSSGQTLVDTWSSIAQAKYDIPTGVTLKQVYTAIAKANYNGNDFDAAMRQGILFNKGDKINLPKEIDINGVKVTLKSDHQAHSATNTLFSTSTSTFRSAKIEQIGASWIVTYNGQQVPGTQKCTSEAEAKALKAQLEAQWASGSDIGLSDIFQANH